MSDDTRDALSLSDDEDNDDLDDESQLPELAGTLCKWTNYIHGWQDRYIVLKDGTLSYYKSENETAFGCRGAVSLIKAVITSHEFDDCRLDVSVNDCMWYLRTHSAEERQVWADALELHKQAESGYGSENSLRRHGSMLSLTSAASLSTASTSSFKGRGLKEKLAEMETFRDILCRQVDTLQNYFDACASAIQQKSVHDITNDDDIDDVDDFDSPQKNSHGGGGGQTQTFTMDVDNDRETKDIVNILQQHGAHAIDFKGQAFTFKATTAGILATLSHCVEVMQQREEAWRKRVEREVEKRKKIEEGYKACLSERHKPIILGGPDYEEGPHSMMNEEEFFDAVDATLDKLDKEEERKTKKGPAKTAMAKVDSSVTHRKIEEVGSGEPVSPMLAEVNRRVLEHITHADMSASDVATSWQLIAEEGEMKVYKRELEENGLVVDPVKAVHTVRGITGHELCHYFWNPEIRMEWDGTLEASNVLQWLSKDTVVTHQVHKRVWPATQRDSLFWSSIRHCPSEDDEGPDYWIVANCSTEHQDSPTPNKCVRIKFNVAMICQTVVQPPQSGKAISRENLTCRIQYSANVNPGGWAPASVVRVISKREVPKFLKNFTAFVTDKTKDKPIMF